MTFIKTAEVYEQKILGLIGLAAKAGQLVKGTDAVLEGIAKRKVHLVIIAADAGKVISADITASCAVNSVELRWQLLGLLQLTLPGELKRYSMQIYLRPNNVGVFSAWRK